MSCPPDGGAAAVVPSCSPTPTPTPTPTPDSRVTCPDGSVRASTSECLPEQTACPGAAVTVPEGEPCPAPRTSPPEPVVCWDGSVREATLDCPPGRKLCPGGVDVPPDGACPDADVPPRCAKGTVRVMGVCTAVAPSDASSQPTGMPPPREAKPGELLFDRLVVAAGDTLFAQGAGCQPGAEVVLTAGGELVGRTTADTDGHFEAVVRFATFRAGYREVTAACGADLTSGVEMVLVAADTSTSATWVLLIFFLLVGFLAVHYQMAARRRRRARSPTW